MALLLGVIRSRVFVLFMEKNTVRRISQLIENFVSHRVNSSCGMVQ